MTVKQIERNWLAREYARLSDELLTNRPEGMYRQRLSASPALCAAAAGMIRLDELNQSDVPVFGLLLRTLLAAQESDGGWGDLVTTAWGLRALLLDRGGGLAVARGLAYVAALQQSQGIWPAIPIRRMPADPLVSAFVLFQLGDSDDFRRAVRFADATVWFNSRCAGGQSTTSELDGESRTMWERARLRCRGRLRETQVVDQSSVDNGSLAAVAGNSCPLAQQTGSELG